MKTLLLLLLLVVAGCTPTDKRIVACSECEGTGVTEIDEVQLMAMAMCQIYMANHVRKCEICEKSMDDSKLPICKEADAKIMSIMETAAKKPKNIQKGECSICGGSGKLIKEQEGVYRNVQK